MSGIVELQQALITALGTGVPVLVGRRELERNQVYPRFVLVPGQERFAAPEGPGASGNPRLLHTRRVGFEVHTWGKDYGATEDLFAAFLTGLRIAVSGANYAVAEGEWQEPADLNAGVVFVAAVVVTFGLAQKTLPIAVPLGDPPPAVTDATAPTALITSTGLDSTGAAAGDGVLTSGEG